MSSFFSDGVRFRGIFTTTLYGFLTRAPRQSTRLTPWWTAAGRNVCRTWRCWIDVQDGQPINPLRPLTLGRVSDTTPDPQ